MEPLLALNDPAHLNATTKTANNANTPFMKNLPLEIRVSVYEFALAEDYGPGDGGIRPVQVASRSNKFKWESLPSLRGAWLPKLIKTPFVSQLTKVCRQIYFELESYPVFYRVNNFVFDQPGSLLKFLAAITPQRRAFIRHLRLENDHPDDIWSLQNSEVYRNKSVRDKIHNAAIMVAHCEDLRVFEVQFCAVRRTWTAPEESTRKALEGIIRMTSNHTGKFSIWSLPYTRPILCTQSNPSGQNLGPYVDPELITIDLSAPQGSPIPDLTAWNTRISIGRLINTARKSVALLRERVIEDEAQGRGFRTQVTRDKLHKALGASNIDFPGEDRVQQDRFASDSGTIATRTRQKCSKGSVNTLGIIETPKNKYSAEGVLTCTIDDILGVRWNDESVIQCEVMYRDDDGHSQRSWENLEATLTLWGRRWLLNHYGSLAIASHWHDPVARFQQVQSIPTPADIINVILGYLRDEPADIRGGIANELQRWRELRKRHADMLERLEQAAAEARATNKANKKRKRSGTVKSRGKATKGRK